MHAYFFTLRDKFSSVYPFHIVFAPNSALFSYNFFEKGLFFFFLKKSIPRTKFFHPLEIFLQTFYPMAILFSLFILWQLFFQIFYPMAITFLLFVLWQIFCHLL